MKWAQVILLIALVIGFFGTIVPMVPGLGLMFGAILIYGFYDGWSMYSPLMAVLAAVFTAIGTGMDYAGSAIGAKRFGASKHGVIASVIGGLIGLVCFSFVGMLIGSVVGLLGVEYYEKRDVIQSGKAALGVLIGNLAAMLIQAVLAVILLVSIFIKMV